MKDSFGEFAEMTQLYNRQMCELADFPNIIENASSSPPWSAYFDTPILSSRTRSKNKPSDLVGQDAAPSQEEMAPAGSTVEPHVHPHPAGVQQTAAVKTDGAAEKAGGKRPTRSARTKGW